MQWCRSGMRPSRAVTNKDKKYGCIGIVFSFELIVQFCTVVNTFLQWITS